MNDILTQRFHLYYPEQIPSNFEISQLPSKILSCVLSVLVQTAASRLIAKQKAATSPTTGPGVAGSNFAPKMGFTLTRLPKPCDLTTCNRPPSTATPLYLCHAWRKGHLRILQNGHRHKIHPVGCRHGLVPGKPLNLEDNVDGLLAITTPGVSRLHLSQGY